MHYFYSADAENNDELETYASSAALCRRLASDYISAAFRRAAYAHYASATPTPEQCLYSGDYFYRRARHCSGDYSRAKLLCHAVTYTHIILRAHMRLFPLAIFTDDALLSKIYLARTSAPLPSRTQPPPFHSPQRTKLFQAESAAMTRKDIDAASAEPISISRTIRFSLRTTPS